MSDFSCFCVFYWYWRAFLYPIFWLLPSKIWDYQIFLWWWYGQSLAAPHAASTYIYEFTSHFHRKNSSPFDVDTLESNFPLSHLVTQMLWQASLAGFDKVLQKNLPNFKLLQCVSIYLPSAISSGCTCTQEEALAAQIQCSATERTACEGKKVNTQIQTAPSCLQLSPLTQYFF